MPRRVLKALSWNAGRPDARASFSSSVSRPRHPFILRGGYIGRASRHSAGGLRAGMAMGKNRTRQPAPDVHPVCLRATRMTPIRFPTVAGVGIVHCPAFKPATNIRHLNLEHWRGSIVPCRHAIDITGMILGVPSGWQASTVRRCGIPAPTSPSCSQEDAGWSFTLLTYVCVGGGIFSCASYPCGTQR